MTSRQLRTERRAAERKAKKAEMKRQKAAAALGITEVPLEADQAAHLSEPNTKKQFSTESIAEAKTTSEAIERICSGSRAQINRANAQHSTGPTSPAGKLASSRNALQHGLASGQVIMPGEDPAQFECLLQDLVAEHQPASATEELLIQEMAQSFWLSQRALLLQNDCFSESGVDEKRLALFLRYQTTYDRAFHKALNALLKIRKERARASKSGFVSQSAMQPAPEIGFVSQNAPDENDFGTLSVSDGEFVWQNQHSQAARASN